MIAFLVLFLVLAAVGVLAQRFGADTRDGTDWHAYDLMAPRHPTPLTPRAPAPAPADAVPGRGGPPRG